MFSISMILTAPESVERALVEYKVNSGVFELRQFSTVTDQPLERRILVFQTVS